MRHLMGLLVMAALLLAACGGTQTARQPDPRAPVSEPAAGEESDGTALAGQRSAPVPVSSGFVSDPPALVRATGRPQVVEFFTYWCTVCRSIKADVHTVEAEYWGTVDFVYLDREDDKNRALVQEFGIFGQPVLVLLDANGQEVQRWFGYVDGDDLRAGIDALLAA